MSAVTETLSSNTSTAALQVIGHFNLSLSGTWSATVTIQRSWDKSTWFDVDTFTSNYEGTGFDAEEVYYRATVSGYASGSVVIRLSDNRNFTGKSVFYAQGQLKMETSWHLSKSVPVTLVLAIVAQTLALVWYISSLDSAVKANARDLIRNETRIESLEGIVQTQAVTLGRMDENIKAIRDSVEKMASK